MSITAAIAALNPRTQRYLKGVLGFGTFRIASIAFSFLNVAVLTRVLDAGRYGQWALLASMVGWATLFDFGIGNGFRNEISARREKGDHKVVVQLVQDGYAYSIRIAIAFAPLVAILVLTDTYTILLDAQNVGNVQSARSAFGMIAMYLALIVPATFYRFVAYGFSSPRLVSREQFIATGLFTVFLVVSLFVGAVFDVWVIATAFIIAQLGTQVLSSYVMLRHVGVLRELSLSALFKGGVFPTRSRYVLRTGVSIFVIQMAAVLLFTGDKLLVAALFGATEIAFYDVYQKLFQPFRILQAVLLVPLWSEVTAAGTAGDSSWIRNAVKTQLVIMASLILLIFVVSFWSGTVITFWTGYIPPNGLAMGIGFGITAFLMAWTNLFAHVLNGLSITQLQLSTSIFALIANIPLSILFGKTFGLGSVGVVLATGASLVPFALLGPLQLLMYLKKGKRSAL